LSEEYTYGCTGEGRTVFMEKKTVSAITLTLLLTGMLTLAFNIKPVKASGTIYIRADGSVDPPTAPISSVDNVTYTFTSNVNDSIAVEKNNTVIDGAGYTLQGGGSARGIELFYVSNVTVKNVRIENWVGEGIFTGYASDSMILGNNITNNSVGIYLAISSNNTISGNNIASDFVGIFLAYSSGNVMSKNTIKNNDLGIEFSGSSNNIISKNIITSNNWGFYLRDGSSDNKIYHNNLINNINQAYPPEDSNVWDDGYPSGGNYWSDCTDIDLYSGSYQNETGSDGIGDTSYVIDAANQDRYPLMKSWPLVGDANRDGIVDVSDLVTIVNAIPSVSGMSNWNPNADINNDGLCDVADLVICIGNIPSAW